MTWSLVSAPDISEQQFSQWSKLLETRVGIRLNVNQKQFLQSQLGIRMRELGEEDFSNYFRRVSDTEKGQLEWSILVDRLLVKETNFFRNQTSLNFVCSHLQDLINNGMQPASYDIWSLGCSTGEEAYSLAILINEVFELAKLEPYFGITATDVSRVAISLARIGRYSNRKLEFVPSSFRYKYFSKADGNNASFEHEIADKICFSCANVLRTDDMPPLEFDVVYCQNMLVYFPQPLRHKILHAIVKKLKPGGILMVGLGEVSNWNHVDMQRIARADVQAYCKNGSMLENKESN